MALNNQPLRLQFHPDSSYIAISSDEVDVGFCTPEFAAKIVETLNEDEKLHEDNETLNKALKMACLDLIKKSGGNPAQVDRLIRKYMENAKRPQHGPRAIAYLLRDRQEQLDISVQEFIKFCDSYKLSPKELKAILNGKDVADEQLRPISRILGTSVQELMEVRDGFSNTEINKLARILGTSSEELAELFD